MIQHPSEPGPHARYQKLRNIGANCAKAHKIAAEKPAIPEHLSVKAQLEKTKTEKEVSVK